MSHAMKTLIASQLKELMKKENIQQITIKQLVDKCKVSRNVFYYNFEDVYTVLQWILDQALEESRTTYKDPKDWKKRFMYLLALSQKDKDFVLNVYNNIPHNELQQYLAERMLPHAQEIVESMLKEQILPPQKMWVAIFFDSLLCGWYVNWLERGMSTKEIEYTLPLVINCMIRLFNQ